MLALVVAGWMLLSALIGTAAERRGRDGLGWFFLSLLVSPLIALLLLVANPPDAEAIAKRDGRVPCPFCAEYVRPQAKICPHCRREFVKSLLSETDNSRESRTDRLQHGTVGGNCGTCRHFKGTQKWGLELNAECDLHKTPTSRYYICEDHE